MKRIFSWATFGNEAGSQPFGKRHINKRGMGGLIEFSVARVSEKYINNRTRSQLCRKISSLKKFGRDLHTKQKIYIPAEKTSKMKRIKAKNKCKLKEKKNNAERAIQRFFFILFFRGQTETPPTRQKEKVPIAKNFKSQQHAT